MEKKEFKPLQVSVFYTSQPGALSWEEGLTRVAQIDTNDNVGSKPKIISGSSCVLVKFVS
ncbi:hypothetical protein HY385_01730 [Candidatus Daviesbacteria bacterium]|nr:hypothetical protein [Candidatus Daviesbacteria bacterium]